MALSSSRKSHAEPWFLTTTTAHSVVIGLSCGVVGYCLATATTRMKKKEQSVTTTTTPRQQPFFVAFSETILTKCKRVASTVVLYWSSVSTCSTNVGLRRLWETTVPWWIVLAYCPSSSSTTTSPWYPLLLWFVLSTTQKEEETASESSLPKKDQGSNESRQPTADAATTAPFNSTDDPFTSYEQPIQTTRKNATTRTSENSSSLPAAEIDTAESSPPPPKRYLEMLVHNVSHTDLVLSVNAPPPDEEPCNERTTSSSSTANDNDVQLYCLCAPRFSTFDMYCRRILSSLTGTEDVVKFPRYKRSTLSEKKNGAGPPYYSIVSSSPSSSSSKHTPSLGGTAAGQRRRLLSTGFALLSSSKADDTSSDTTTASALTIPCHELPNLRFRGRDAHRIEPYYCHHHDDSRDSGVEEERPSPLHLSHVFFPLLATLLPKWQQELTQKYNSSGNSNSNDNTNIASSSLKQVVVLVSGVGTPRNWTHSVTGNSTQACAELMERFIHRLYPQVTVVRIHSDTNIFRYDENIIFVKRELMPCIDAYRDAHARGLPYPDECIDGGSTKTELPSLSEFPFSPDWKQSFAVTLSFADGSHARTHAIQTSLRPYRPTYFHLWQLKSFWHDTKIVEDDLEVHSFEDMETVPAMDVKCLAQEVSDKHVPLVVQEMIAFRNDFLESVLQHDNDITTFWLRKTQKPVLAVLLVADKSGRPVMYRGTNMEVSMPTGSLCAERNVIGSALACNPALKRQDVKMVAVLAVPLELIQRQEMVRPPNMPRSTSLASYSSVQEEEDETTTDWVIPAHTVDGMTAVERISTQESVPVYHVREGVSSDFTPRSTPPGTPVRRITLYTRSQDASADGAKPTMGMGRSKKLKKTVLVHSAKDLNPLRPCGACNEWLKKICECNPYFKVLTFTDADCNGVYISQCQD